MSQQNKGRASQRTLMLAQTALLAAIMVVLQATGIGLIKVGLFSLTILNLPVIIGAITVGRKGGMVLGGLFGFLILADAPLFLAINPQLTVIFLMGIRGVLYGLLCALVFEAFKKIDKTQLWSFGVSGLTCAVLNTVIFVLGTLVIFGSSDMLRTELAADSLGGVFAALIAIVGVQAIIEFFLCAVLTMTVAKPVTLFLNKQ